jgi:hypothetical protein
MPGESDFKLQLQLPRQLVQQGSAKGARAVARVQLPCSCSVGAGLGSFPA